MRLGKNPVFRRAMVPWYDSETMCLGVIVLMFLAFLFGIAGISIAGEDLRYGSYLWIALLIVGLSSGVIISTTVRLIKRYAGRISK